MSTCRIGITLLFLSLVAPLASYAQQWTAHEWSGAPPQNWSFDQVQRIITIAAPGTYKFFATSGPLNSDPLSDIQEVRAPGVSGTVTVSIVRSPATGGGAAGQTAALAAQLRASVSPERMDTLIDAVTALAANPPDGSTIPWDLVLVELMP